MPDRVDAGHPDGQSAGRGGIDEMWMRSEPAARRRTERTSEGARRRARGRSRFLQAVGRPPPTLFLEIVVHLVHERFQPGRGVALSLAVISDVKHGHAVFVLDQRHDCA